MRKFLALCGGLVAAYVLVLGVWAIRDLDAAAPIVYGMGIRISDSGTYQGTAGRINCTNNLNCSVASGVATFDVTGGGTIGGSSGSTDNRVIRADGAGGSTVQASEVTIDDTGNIVMLDVGDTVDTRDVSVDGTKLDGIEAAADNTVGGSGLTESGSTINVGAGTGISVAADSVAVDQTTNFAFTGNVTTEDLTLKTHAAYTGSGRTWKTCVATTTDATPTSPTDCQTTLADEAIYGFEMRCVVRNTTSANRGIYYRTASYYREGGGAATQHAAPAAIAGETETDPGLLATMVATSNNANVQVTGLAGTTLYWACWVAFQAVSTDT